MPVIMKDNVQYAYTTKGTVFHTLSNAEYEALPESEKMNGDVYCIPDREPVINPDQLWEKVGTGTLDIGDDLTDGVNQLNSSLPKRLSGTLPSTDNTFTIEYPSGLSKSNMALVGFGFYRNASWYYNTNAVSVVFTNTNISVTIPADYSFIKGLLYALIYIKID